MIALTPNAAKACSGFRIWMICRTRVCKNRTQPPTEFFLLSRARKAVGFYDLFEIFLSVRVVIPVD